MKIKNPKYSHIALVGLLPYKLATTLPAAAPTNAQMIAMAVTNAVPFLAKYGCFSYTFSSVRQ
jgi:hypothetical protein